ncbi:efflux RND transporter periplasmic adaptor subunit [Roseateles flavus]|uniref:Efflux RND transporter periplasmic adaptor subunit n=1 Tax=Roseateles flavus TaxID=3149041 RepID=A0ABV0GJP2_9BURK
MLKNRRRWVVLGSVITSAVLAGWAWNSQASSNTRPSPFKSAQIDEGAITQVIMANGSLQPVSTVTVGTPVSGTVAQRLVDFNDKVVKGQVLARLDSANFEARERQARAQLASAEARLAFAEGTLRRNEALAAQGFISTPQRDQSLREAEAARADRELARAQLDAARTDLNNSIIRAPVDGVVIKRSIDVGQTVAASFQTPELFLIARDLNEMVIQANVSEADVGQIREGQKVRFLVDAFPSREFEGSVQQFRLNPTNTQGVVTYTVIVNVSNPEGLLKPGMTAQTRIVVASSPKALRLPTAALRFKPNDDELPGKGGKKAPAEATASATSTDDGVLSSLRGGDRVFKVYTEGANRKLEAREVTIGISNTRYTELLSGDLKPGDTVVIRRAKADSREGA